MTWLRAMRKRDDAGVVWIEGAAGALRSWAEVFSDQILAADGSPTPWNTEAPCGDLLALAPWIGKPRRPSEKDSHKYPKVPKFKLEDTFQLQLWPLAAERAWRQGAFTDVIARRLLAVLRRRYPMVEPRPSGARPAAWPVPRISPWTWWLLLDVVGVPAIRELGRHPWRWSRRRLAGRLTGVTRRLLGAAPPGWADFWDQWLLGEVLVRVTSDGKAPGLSWNPLLNAMPWLHRLPELSEKLTDPEPSDDGGSPVRGDWQERQPPWILVHPDD